MDSHRKTAIIVGALILIAYGVLGSLFLESKIMATLLELISGAAVVGMAVLMFPILKPHNKNLTFGYAVVKTIEGVFIIVAGILLFSLIINQETYDWIYGIHTYIFGMAFLILSYLFYQSKLVPRFISVWGVIASILLLSSTLINMMAAGTVILTDSTVIPFTVSTIPVILNELLLAVWLIMKGFNPYAIASESAKTV
jgi:hypothetical protein